MRLPRSSFLASRAEHPLLEAWQERVHNHWKLPAKDRPNLEYFWQPGSISKDLVLVYLY